MTVHLTSDDVIKDNVTTCGPDEILFPVAWRQIKYKYESIQVCHILGKGEWIQSGFCWILYLMAPVEATSCYLTVLMLGHGSILSFISEIFQLAPECRRENVNLAGIWNGGMD